MNPTKKIIQELELKIDSHELWTKGEVRKILNQAWLEAANAEKFDESIEKKLKDLVKEIKEIPDGDVDRYLIINEIDKIIKEIQN